MPKGTEIKEPKIVIVGLGRSGISTLETMYHAELGKQAKLVGISQWGRALEGKDFLDESINISIGKQLAFRGQDDLVRIARESALVHYEEIKRALMVE